MSAAFQFCFMALALDVINGHGPSNKNASPFTAREDYKVMLYYPFI